MGLLDRILGTSAQTSPQPKAAPPPPSADDAAVERYRYMLRTAPPETLERAHAEAFAKLTSKQRRRALELFAQAAPPDERAATSQISSDDSAAMGRLATRTEIRQPGFLERSFGGGGAMGLGGSLLTSFAAGFVGSMVAQSFFASAGGFGDNDGDVADGRDGNAEPNEAADDGSAQGDFDSQVGEGDFGGGDFDV